MKIKNKNIVYYFLPFYFFLYTFTACNTTEPNNSQNISLTLEDVSCTEAWLKLETENINLPVSVSLLQNNIVGQTFSLSKPDTIIYIDSLKPNKTYTFQSVIQAFNQSSSIENPVSSSEIRVTTLDTTSHNFTWQKFTFGGEAGSSVLYDVAIIDENNIWAVGKIYLKDSTGQPDPKVYNAVHWNGETWQVKRITTKFRGNQITVPLEGIFAFSGNDIWMVGSLPIHGNGENWTMYDLRTTVDPSLSLSKAWGTNSNNMYFIGRGGSIAHYKNGQWSKIESETDLQFLDIYGAVNNKTGQQEILAVCTRNYPPGKGVYKIYDNTAQEISSKIPKAHIPELFGVWFVPARHYYIVGDGIYEKRLLLDSVWENGPLDITNYATTKITGNALNDIFVVGAFGEFLHFNGLRWQSFRNSTALSNGTYTSVAVKGNIVAAAGTNNASAVIVFGRR